MGCLGDGSFLDGCLPGATVPFVLAVSRSEASFFVVEDASDDGVPGWMARPEVLDEISPFFFAPESPPSGLADSEITLFLTWLSGVTAAADSSEDCVSTVDGWEPTEGNGAFPLSGSFSVSAILNESGS